MKQSWIFKLPLIEMFYQIFKKRLMDELEVKVHPRGATSPLQDKWTKA